MTDEQLEQGIEAIQVMLAARDAGTNAKVIEAGKSPARELEVSRSLPRTRRKTDGIWVTTMGTRRNTTAIS